MKIKSVHWIIKILPTQWWFQEFALNSLFQLKQSNSQVAHHSYYLSGRIRTGRISCFNLGFQRPVTNKITVNATLKSYRVQKYFAINAPWANYLNWHHSIKPSNMLYGWLWPTLIAQVLGVTICLLGVITVKTPILLQDKMLGPWRVLYNRDRRLQVLSSLKEATLVQWRQHLACFPSSVRAAALKLGRHVVIVQVIGSITLGVWHAVQITQWGEECH